MEDIFQVITLTEASEMLGVTGQAIRKWIAKNKLNKEKYRKSTNTYIFVKSYIEELKSIIEKNTENM